MGGDINLHANSLLQAAEERLNLASVASPGNMILTDEGLELENFTQRGILTAESTTLEVSGQGAGSIYIRAGKFFLNDSQILGKTNGSQTGGITDIAVVDLTLENSDISNSTRGTGKGGDIIINAEGTVNLSGFDYGLFSNALRTGHAGNITIIAKDLEVFEGAQIASSTLGLGQGGSIDINVTNNITLSSFSRIAATSEKVEAGNAGRISLQANELNITDSSEISSLTFGMGHGGEIAINVNQLNLSTARILASSEAFYFDDETGEEYYVDNAGDAGIISIQANNLSLTDGAQIASSTFGSGQGGSININVTDTISFEGSVDIFPSGITATTEHSGNAGSIKLTATHLEIKKGAGISSVTWYDIGKGGEIIINATDSIYIAGAVSETLFEAQETKKTRGITSASQRGSLGNAGQITINAPLLILTGDGEISTSAELANAGKIELNVEQLQISDNAAIVSESQGDGDAGNIRIIASESIGLNNAKISTEAAVAAGGNIVVNVPNLLDMQDGSITTSVQDGTGGGGDITIKHSDEIPAFVILDNAKIIAQAYQGPGGNIRIKAEQFIASPDSLVSASSQLGIDGNVEIDSPDENVSEGMLGLSASHLDASNLIKPPCEAMSYEDYINRSRFIVIPLAGSSPSPFDLQPSRLSPSAAQKLIKTSRAGSQTESQSNKPRQLLALLTICQPPQPETEKTVMPEQLF
jgi:large exoprotein involved in heme utilization and adhesion